MPWHLNLAWWCGGMEMISTLLTFCEGKPPVISRFSIRDQWCEALTFCLFLGWPSCGTTIEQSGTKPKLVAKNLPNNFCFFFVTYLIIFEKKYVQYDSDNNVIKYYGSVIPHNWDMSFQKFGGLSAVVAFWENQLPRQGQISFHTPIWKTDVSCHGNVCPSARPSEFSGLFSAYFQISFSNLVYIFSR